MVVAGPIAAPLHPEGSSNSQTTVPSLSCRSLQVTCYQAQVRSLDVAFREINAAITAAITHSKPVYISIPGLCLSLLPFIPLVIAVEGLTCALRGGQAGRQGLRPLVHSCCACCGARPAAVDLCALCTILHGWPP